MNEVNLSNEIILSNYLSHKDFRSKEEIEVFNSIIYKLDPTNTGDFFRDVFDSFMNDFVKPDPIFKNTVHENIFSKLFPFLEKQVVFGLGKDAYKKYKVLKYTADFYNREDNVIWEIDGDNHKNGLQKLKDEKRDLILELEYQAETIRISNKEVEELLLERIRDRKVVEKIGTIE